MNEARTAGLKKAINRIEKKVRQNYDTDMEFHRASGLPLAYYTVRRVFDHTQEPPKLMTLLLVAQAAGLRAQEVREILLEAGDKHIFRLIGTGDRDLSKKEEALLDAIRKITEREPRVWDRMIDSVDLSARAAQVDVAAEVNAMRR